MPMQNTNLGGAATGTATSAQVLQGYTFSNASGNDIAGTVVDNGAPTLQPGDSIASGYYSGGSVAAASVAVPASGSQSFTTPGSTSFTVPSEVTRLLAQIWSGGGGGVNGYTGGQGAYASALLSVTPGQTLDMIVGSGGTSGANGTAGGFSAIYNEYSPLIQVPGGGAATSSAVGSGAVAPTSGIFTHINGASGLVTNVIAPGASSVSSYGGAGWAMGINTIATNVTTANDTSSMTAPSVSADDVLLILFTSAVVSGVTANSVNATCTVDGVSAGSPILAINPDSSGATMGILAWLFPVTASGTPSVDFANFSNFQSAPGSYTESFAINLGPTQPGSTITPASGNTGDSVTFPTSTLPTVNLYTNNTGSGNLTPSISGNTGSTYSVFPNCCTQAVLAFGEPNASVSIALSTGTAVWAQFPLSQSSFNGTDGAIIINW